MLEQDKTEERKILFDTDMPKFDFAFLNPPYGTGGNATLHLEFVQEALNRTTGQVVALFPFSFVKNVNVLQNAKKINEYKANFSKTLTYVKEYTNTAEYFPGSCQDSIGVYFFDMNKSITDKITIEQPNRTQNISSLADFSPYTSEESVIIDYFKRFPMQKFFGKILATDKCKGMTQEQLDNNIKNSTKDLKEYMSQNESYILIVNRSNGSLNGKILSKNVGNIYKEYEDLLKFGLESQCSTGHNAFVFDSLLAAENFKKACMRSLLRWLIYKTQSNQHMYEKVYRYIPSIDWSDPMTHTDAGILQMLGMNYDEAEKAAAYTKKIIDELDNAK